MVPFCGWITQDVDVISAIKGQPALNFTNTTRNLPIGSDSYTMLHLLKLSWMAEKTRFGRT
jgi:hypothetical protein